MNSIYLLFILSLTFIHSIYSKSKSNSTYISNPKNAKVERFFNIGSIQKLKHNLKSSLLPAKVIEQILNFKGNNANITYDEMKGDYKLDDYYGTVKKKGNLIVYEIFHSVIEASPQKLKTETIDCNRKWYTLWIKEYCYKKTKRIFRTPDPHERKIIKSHLIKMSRDFIKQKYPQNSLNKKTK